MTEVGGILKLSVAVQAVIQVLLSRDFAGDIKSTHQLTLNLKVGR